MIHVGPNPPTGVAAGKESLIQKAGLDDLHGLRPHWHAGNLEAALAVGQGAGVGIALNLHQGARERRAGGGVQHHAMNGRQRARRSSVGLRGRLRAWRNILLRREQRGCQQKRGAEGKHRQSRRVPARGEMVAGAFMDCKKAHALL